MKCLLMSLFLCIPIAGFSFGWDDMEPQNDVANGDGSTFTNTIPSEETYNAIQAGMQEQTGMLRSGSVPGGPGGGNSNSGITGTPIGEVAYIPILLLVVAYGLYSRHAGKKKRAEE